MSCLPVDGEQLCLAYRTGVSFRQGVVPSLSRGLVEGVDDLLDTISLGRILSDVVTKSVLSLDDTHGNAGAELGFEAILIGFDGLGLLPVSIVGERVEHLCASTDSTDE